MLHKTFAPKRLLFCALLVCSTNASWSQDKTNDAKTYADSVLSMFDRGRYSEMYDEFDPRSRTLTREQWIQTADTLAKQRGKLVKRTPANKAKSMGIYRFLYKTECTNGKVIEDVGVSDNTGSWKLVGFLIKPDLE